MNIFQRISQRLPKFIIIPVALMYFAMLSNAFLERTCKHESERKSYESKERWFNKPLFASKHLQAERMPKVIERPGVFSDRNYRINKKDSGYSLLVPSLKSAQRRICLNFLP